MMSFFSSSPRPKWLNRKLRDLSRSTSCSAGHDSAASSGASKSFSIHAEYRFSVARLHVSRNGQTLFAVARGGGGCGTEHGDFARDRAALRRRPVARERRVPRSHHRRCDLGKPEIRRTAVALTRFDRDVSVGRDQRKLTLERLLNGEDDAQRRALPRRDRRGQDRKLGRVLAAAGRTFACASTTETKNAPAISNNAVTAAANWRAGTNRAPWPPSIRYARIASG